MSKLVSDEQIENIAKKKFSSIKEPWRDLEHEAIYIDGFRHAFTLLMPITEKQNEALGELVHHCRDYALTEESFVIAMAVDKATDAIQETKQMLENLGEKK